jgi:hypothetical protein
MGLAVLETLVEKCPSWGYLVLLLVAFTISVVVAGIGMRMVGGLAQRMRRMHPTR